MVGQIDRFIAKCDSCNVNITLEQMSITRFFDEIEKDGWWVDRGTRRTHCHSCVKIVWKVGKNCEAIIQGTPDSEVPF